MNTNNCDTKILKYVDENYACFDKTKNFQECEREIDELRQYDDNDSICIKKN
jgi:hypothetical protein